MKVCARLLANALLALLVAACAGDDDSSADDPARSSAPQLKTCDPLQGEEQPIALGKVLAVGRDGEGVLYVLVDPGSEEYQVFVSEDGALQRHRVLGASRSGDPMWISVGVEADAPFGLWAAFGANGVTTMRRFDTADAVDKSQEPDGEDLEVLSEGDIGGLKLRNVPPGVATEYLGTIEDGRRVLVVRPTDDWSYDDFRVFLGKPNKMLERDVQNVSRSKSGPTFIELTLDNKSATLDFEITYSVDHVNYGASTLKSDGRTLSIVLDEAPEPSVMDGLRFFCR